MTHKSVLLCAAGSIAVMSASAAAAQTTAPEAAAPTTAPASSAQTDAPAVATQTNIPAPAQTTPSSAAPADANVAGASQDIIVTAQKREQSINSVPLSITAATGDQLALAGIRSPNDLGKITPGFSFGQNNVGTPVYTLRGVGYNDNSLSARPAVTVYLDEAPLPFATETQGVGLDVERVEVLKGPQGTLFGNNSTGGAINYIAAKPTDRFSFGGTATYGRFDQTEIEGYVSGPITSTLSARLAVEHNGMNGWQYSLSRPNDRLGKRDFTNGRAILLWRPSSDLRAQLTISRWIDRGDTQAPQVTRINPQIPVPAIINLTQVPTIRLAPRDPRAADWTADTDFENDNRYFQAALRLDYDLSDRATLTSLTSYNNLRVYHLSPAGGTAFQDAEDVVEGYAHSISQELRVTGNLGDLTALAGAVYSHDSTEDNLTTRLAGATLAYAFVNLGAPLFKSLTGFTRQKSDTYAVFGNAEYRITPQLTVQGGVRYTKYDLDVGVCARDSGDGNAAAVFQVFANAQRAGRGLPPIGLPATGSCVSLFTDPADTARFLTPGELFTGLHEDNVSWRGGLNFTAVPGTLLYANVSRGYKAGGFSPFGGFSNAGYVPARQESVTAYEAGLKSRVLDRVLQFNGAVFYSDYRNKQVLGNRIIPVLGTAVALDNIPKSRIYGAEFSAVLTPATGLSLLASGGYTKTEILDGYTGTNADSVTQDFTGTPLPFAPKWQFNGSATYQWALTDHLGGFANASVSYQSESFAYLGGINTVRLNPRTLTDLQAGIEGPNGSWRAYAWGRNIFNQYYGTSAARVIDTSVRWTGMPATYGVTLSFRY